MKLSRKQFDILSAMVEDKTAAKTQRELESITGFSLGTVNRVVNELVENGLIKDGKIYNIPRRLQHQQARKAGLDL